MSGPIKIVHLISDLSTGGAELMLYRLLSRMDRSRYENVVVSLTDLGTLGRSIEQLGIRVHTLGKRQESATNTVTPWKLLHLCLAGIWRLITLLKRERPKILQTWLYHSDLIGLVTGKLAGVSAIAWNLRCTELRSQRDVALRMLAALSPCPQVVLVNSVSGRRFHESKGYRPRAWVHIPNGFDLDTFRPDHAARASLRNELGISCDTLLIGLIARIDPLKDHGNFLLAARLLLKKHPEVRFLLAGLGTDARNASLVTELIRLGLESHVHLLGERKDIPCVMAALDILTSSSSAEGFPNVVGEAMACGVPCVVTDVGDSSFLIGDTGRVVPSRDPEALAQAWSELAGMNREKRQRLGLAARDRIKTHFDLASVVKQYERCYEELAAQSYTVGPAVGSLST